MRAAPAQVNPEQRRDLRFGDVLLLDGGHRVACRSNDVGNASNGNSHGDQAEIGWREQARQDHQGSDFDEQRHGLADQLDHGALRQFCPEIVHSGSFCRLAGWAPWLWTVHCPFDATPTWPNPLQQARRRTDARAHRTPRWRVPCAETARARRPGHWGGNITSTGPVDAMRHPVAKPKGVGLDAGCGHAGPLWTLPHANDQVSKRPTAGQADWVGPALFLPVFAFVRKVIAMLQARTAMPVQSGPKKQDAVGTPLTRECPSAAAAKSRAGDWVEVRSKEEILATLDERGRLDGMPFMPQMFRYCGQQFQVHKRAHKTCDTVSGKALGLSLTDGVHLDLRCDGNAYGGCQAACLVFWKEAWLKPADQVGAGTSNGMPAASTTGRPRQGCTEAAVNASTRHPEARDDQQRYSCQRRELLAFTKPLKWWDPRRVRRSLPQAMPRSAVSRAALPLPAS